MPLSIIRTLVLIIIWPLLIIGSLYIDIKGRKVYELVKGSLVGKVTRVLVFTMLVAMHSLGLIGTVYMFSDTRGIYLVVPLFLILALIFGWALKVLLETQKEAKKIISQR